MTAGPAQILTTILGQTPQLYDVEIEKVSDAEEIRNMVIHVTDPDLLGQTGGIVQGMSGSPILQNGRLAGAVTHVLVNDPTRGYAIFAETMLAPGREPGRRTGRIRAPGRGAAAPGPAPARF